MSEAAERPYTLQVMHAAAESDLPPHLRHFVMTLALLAKSDTGVGWHSQPTIANAMGIQDRQVRRYFKELAQADGSREADTGQLRPLSPVAVERRRRGTPDGKGRSSDEWRLVVLEERLNRSRASSSGQGSTGHGRPLETPSTGHESPVEPPLPEAPAGAQPDIHGSSTGHPRQLNRTPTSGERRMNVVENDGRSVSTSETANFALKAPSPKSGKRPAKQRKVKPRSENVGAHAEVVACYHDAFRARHDADPCFGGAEGSAVKRLLNRLGGNGPEACRRVRNALQSWRGANVTILDVAKNPDAFLAANPPNGGRKGVHQPQPGDIDDVEEQARARASKTAHAAE